MNENNLKQYFKNVKKCKKCSRNYGVDFEEREIIDICPICMNQVIKKYLGTEIN